MCYIKPVQTGTEHDAAKITEIASLAGNDNIKQLLKVKTLNSWLLPASPHLSAKREAKPIPTPASIAKDVFANLENAPMINIVETAGGVLSPCPDGSLQANLYHMLSLKRQFKTLLIGDPNLGGISTTLTAYEALTSRFIFPDVICLISSPENERVRENYGYLERYFQQGKGKGDLHQVKLVRIHTDVPAEDQSLTPYYSNPSVELDFSKVVNALGVVESKDNMHRLSNTTT